MMQLLKYVENKSYDNAIMSHLFSEISLYIHSFLMLQCEIFQQLSLYAHAQQTYFICR